MWSKIRCFWNFYPTSQSLNLFDSIPLFLVLFCRWWRCMACWLWVCLCGISWFCLFSSCAFGWCCLHCRSTPTSAHGTSRPPERGFSSCSSPGLTAATYSPLILISTRDANDLLTIKNLSIIDSAQCVHAQNVQQTHRKKRSEHLGLWQWWAGSLAWIIHIVQNMLLMWSKLQKCIK